MPLPFRFFPRLIPVGFLCLFAAVVNVHAVLSYSTYLTVGSSSGTGKSDLDASHYYTYNFGVTTSGAGDYQLDTIKVIVDRGQNTTAPITVTLYSGAGATGSVLATATLPAASVSASGSQTATIAFGSGTILTAGVYSFRVSTTAQPGNTAYGFRNDTAATLVLTSSGVTVASSDWIQDSNSTGNATTTLTVSSPVRAEASLSSISVDLGRYHVGASPTQNLTLTNSALITSSTEGLRSSGLTAGAASLTGLTGSDLAAQATDDFTVGLSIASAGTQNGTVTLSFNSVATGGSLTALSSQQITVSGTGYSGQASWTKASGGTWSDFANWDATGGKPGVDGALSTHDTATFSDAIAGVPAVVTLDGANPVLTSLTFNHAGAGYTIATGTGGSLTLGTASAAATVVNLAGAHTISANIALANATEVQTAAGTNLTISGGISGAGSLTKSGSGNLTLSGSNSLSGATTLSAGRLAVNGTLPNSILSTSAGTVLSGTGTIGTATIGGQHAPGNSAGIQSFTQLTYQAGSSIDWELLASTATGRGSSFDGINVGNTLTFGGATSLVLSFGGTVNWNDVFWASDRQWTVFSVGGSTVSGNNLSLAAAAWTDANGATLHSIRPDANFSISMGGSGGQDVLLDYVASAAAVPEPASYAMVVAGLAMGWVVRRRASRRDAQATRR
jgi:autotransporter-associated beta strand protein